MKELGVLSNPNYKITALLDHLAMITVQSDTLGVFDCKPLGVIWGKFAEVGAFVPNQESIGSMFSLGFFASLTCTLPVKSLIFLM